METKEDPADMTHFLLFGLLGGGRGLSDRLDGSRLGGSLANGRSVIKTGDSGQRATHVSLTGSAGVSSTLVGSATASAAATSAGVAASSLTGSSAAGAAAV